MGQTTISVGNKVRDVARPGLLVVRRIDGYWADIELIGRKPAGEGIGEIMTDHIEHVPVKDLTLDAL